MKRLSNLVAAGLVLIALGIPLISGGCSTKDEGFAIYLTTGDIPPSKMEALSHVDIADKPVIASSDIISYKSSAHVIELTTDAFDRIASLKIPLSGKSFVVCVDKKPIYWGAFWTIMSSMSFGGVTVMQPLPTQEAKTITLELGYPTQSFYNGTDPRGNAEIIQAMEKAGKLVQIWSLPRP